MENVDLLGAVRDPSCGGPSWPMYTHPSGYSTGAPSAAAGARGKQVAGVVTENAARGWGGGSGVPEPPGVRAPLPTGSCSKGEAGRGRRWAGRPWAGGRGARPRDGARVLSGAEPLAAELVLPRDQRSRQPPRGAACPPAPAPAASRVSARRLLVSPSPASSPRHPAP